MEIIKKLIESKRARIGIIGLGYVGLPLAVEFAKSGFFVTGLEIDRDKTNKLNRGISYVKDVPSASVQSLGKNKKLSATTDFKQLHKMDVVIICVPTPLRKTKDPDISFIVSALEKVEKGLRKGQLIILESTTYPGTTRDILLPVLEKKGFVVGKDFYLAFSPERVDPGNSDYGIKNTPKIVGGITPKCSQLAQILYGHIVEKVVAVSTTESAEMVKLLENTFRAVNIGLVNEVALMCDRLKLDVFEVIDAASTKPFGFMPFYPGPGIGGHCIPLDPQYLSWKLKSLNFYSRFIELAGEINSKMPEHLVDKIADALNGRGKSLKNAKILMIGVAYKKDIDDIRESPALDVMDLLCQKKAALSYHDPFVPSLKMRGLRMKSVPLTNANLRRSDCVVITTHHSSLNIKQIIDNSPLVVDSRNATKNFKNKNVIKL